MTSRRSHIQNVIKEIDIHKEERFEDYTNATFWERFVSELQLILHDWCLKSRFTQSLPSEAKLKCLRKAELKFQSFVFQLEQYGPVHYDKFDIIDDNSTETLLIQASFNLDEFLLLSPADPEARRLVGTTRLRLLLSSVEISLADSHCEIPLLIQYGVSKFYYGLSLKKSQDDVETNSNTKMNNFVPTTGLLKSDFAMSHFELAYDETSLAKFVDIFTERLGFCDDPILISSSQYYKLIKLHFVPSSSTASRDIDDFRQKFLSSADVNLQLNLLVKRPKIESEHANHSASFSSLVPITSDLWYLDLVVVDAERVLLKNTLDSLAEYILKVNNNSSSVAKGNLESLHPLPTFLLAFMSEFVLETNRNVSEVPTDFLTQDLSSPDLLDRELANLLGCFFPNGILVKLAGFFHFLLKILEASLVSAAIPRFWISIVRYLVDVIDHDEDVPESTSLPAGGDGKNTDNPLEEVVSRIESKSTISVHERHSSDIDDDDESFFDAEETIVSKSTSSKVSSSEALRSDSISDQISALSPDIGLTFFSPYVCLYQLQAFHRLALSTELMPWYAEQLCILRETLRRNLNTNRSDILSSLKENLKLCQQIFHRFHRKIISIVCLYELLLQPGNPSRNVPRGELLHLSKCLVERDHVLHTFPALNSNLGSTFNVSENFLVPLHDQLRPYVMSVLARRQIDETTVRLQENDQHTATDSFIRVCSDMIISSPDYTLFPAFRHFSITTANHVRRPNAHLSRPGNQRLFVSLVQHREPNLPCLYPARLLDQLRFPPDKADSAWQHSSPVDALISNFDVVLGGCFSRDCDIF